jgi:hypothetical protein
MNRIACFTKSEPFRAVVGSLRGFSVSFCDSSAELAKRVVEETDLLCLIVHIPSWDAYWGRFFPSLHQSFPFLNALLVGAEPESPEIPYPVIAGVPETPGLPGKIEEFLSTLKTREKRGHQRFDWPLMGAWEGKGEAARTFRVRSISAGGAFLESVSFFPVPGTLATLRIQFLDFQLLTGCEALSKRDPSGSLPSGFGVRFTDLSDASRKVVDLIVQDELIMSLTEPEKPRKPPSIG